MQRLSIAFILLATSLQAQAGLQFIDAWSPEAPPGRTMAGFMSIENDTSEPISLVSGTSPQFGRVEIHDVINDDGVMRMRKTERLTIEPNGTLVLRSGSYHLMLMEPKVNFEIGQDIDVVFEDDQGKAYALTLEVRSR